MRSKSRLHPGNAGLGLDHMSEQTFEARRENLSQANKLSRTYAALLDALNRHRGGNKNAFRHGRYTAEAITWRRGLAELETQHQHNPAIGNYLDAFYFTV